MEKQMRDTSSKPPVPKYLDSRVKLLQQRLRGDDIDGMLISNPHDILYLTDFVGEDSFLWMPATGSRAILISDDRFKEHIPAEAPHLRVFMRSKNGKNNESLAEAAARSLRRRKIKRIGIQAPYLRLAERKSISKAFGAKHITDYDDGLLKQRSVKDSREIKYIKESVRIQQLAFCKLREHIQIGMTEIEVAGYLEYQMRCLGADDRGFKPIVAFDGHASHSHAIPDRRKLKKNSAILIDWGAKYHHYVSDMTRVLNMGKPKRHIAEIHKIVEEALHIGIDKVEPGVTLREVDDAVRTYMHSKGYKLDHGLGHGIGLAVHEHPFIGPYDTRLEPGQVITIEPGIYLGKRGGVRLENDVLVTAKGSESLSTLPTDLQWSILEA